MGEECSIYVWNKSYKIIVSKTSEETGWETSKGEFNIKMGLKLMRKQKILQYKKEKCTQTLTRIPTPGQFRTTSTVTAMPLHTKPFGHIALQHPLNQRPQSLAWVSQPWRLFYTKLTGLAESVCCVEWI